jgi:hypothetical protein
MVNVEVGNDDGVKLAEIHVPTQLDQGTGSKIACDVRLAARDEEAAAALAGIWPSSAAAERDELHR